jgi:hypothetical protein
MSIRERKIKMPVPAGLQTLTDQFFKDYALEYDMAHANECGKYMEALVPHCQKNGFPKVGQLRKNPGQTQYNGHAIDALAYDLGNNLTHAVDCIARAEQPHPWVSEGGTNQDPGPNFSEDTTAYKTDTDWLEKPGEPPMDDVVPWVAYDENGFQNLKLQLDYDYGRRPQGADFDVSVWAARTFHSCYMGPEKEPLGMNNALVKHRAEWCQGLKINVDNHWCTTATCQIGNHKK